jgi:SAM-dependent methyltransferase
MTALKRSFSSFDLESQDEETAYRSLVQRVDTLKPPRFWPAAPGKPPLTALERTGLIRMADAIPGLCGEETMVALIEAMRHAPSGDVVEIGSGRGRSTAMLAWLARRYEIGQVLCIDPWTDVAEAAADEALHIFEINLAPLAQGRVNYLRARSIDAAVAYGPGLTVTTEAFGTSVYQGCISVLHIDGAHSEPEVATDCAVWAPHVAPGGWIVFDDDPQASGDGSQRVAAAFAERESARIVARFQAGPATFIQLKR